MGSALLVEQFTHSPYVCHERLYFAVHLGHSGHIVRKHVSRIVLATPCTQAHKLILRHPHARLAVIPAGVAVPLSPLCQDLSSVLGSDEYLGIRLPAAFTHE